MNGIREIDLAKKQVAKVENPQKKIKKTIMFHSMKSTYRRVIDSFVQSTSMRVSWSAQE